MGNSDFLKFLINEDIYLIKDQTMSAPVESNASSNERAAEAENSSYQPQSDILVLFEGQATDEMPLPDMELLSKILGAVKCSLDQVDIRPNALPIPLRKYAKVISFTTNYSFSQTVKYSMYEEGSTKVVLADPLTIISPSQELKRSLWGAIQQVFK